ncbi:MAG TPA: GNAT family N-acetyltransferase [Firmicutes bacterium]|jgi:ribosomal protein S18 acetylase RimI-like enzyme|nr:GNAT family N-acetyltransferase [Bacillota bacterium]
MDQSQPKQLEHVFSFSPGDDRYFQDCAEALFESEQGHKYFSDLDQVKHFLQLGFAHNEIYICTNKHHDFIGFIWANNYGAFNYFPFLQAIAVKPVFRSIGAGTFLMRQFEEAFPDAPLFFLIANPDNLGAYRFYERLGYCPVGKVPDMFICGTTEIIMVKSRNSPNTTHKFSLYKVFRQLSLKGIL